MSKKYKYRSLFMIVLALFIGQSLFAQEPEARQTIRITSTYKPKLLSPAKIELIASPAGEDTSRPQLHYSIPAQNLFFSYNPAVGFASSIRIDSSILLGTRNYVKVGYGSSYTPYVEGAVGTGNGDDYLLNLYANYTSGKGTIKYQDFYDLNAKATGSFYTGDHEIYGSIGVRADEHYQYGYDHDSYTYTKDDLRRKFQTMSLGIGLKNSTKNDLNINYDPHLELYGFSRQSQVDESTLVLNLPAEMAVNDNVKAEIAIRSNISGYRIKDGNLKINNSLFQVAPAVSYSDDLFNIHAGITPSWNNGESKILPDIYGELKLQENVFSIQGGWVGRYIANSFRTLSNENPYISDPLILKNTQETQYYGGIKASLGGHFNVNAKAALIVSKNVPLFLNNALEPQKIDVVNESRLRTFQIHGDLNYVLGDALSVTGGLDINSYSGLKDNAEAWGLYPLAIKGSVRWKAIENLTIKGDLMSFSGAYAWVPLPGAPAGEVKDMKGGTDLSAGAQYDINQMFGVWLDLNNILNSKYEYWNNYPVFGIQVIGGVVVRF